ncbi:PREDICTED: uncharacterized protein LOC105970252 [Erythranthe guttata]|uniref:uncharacterized protein LOC105970252 n=1 Tax=Erythranthe guttata TaxID=4155 RepID=UPI00064E0178|nr:PREDICTED: uncharacterized protein LOC105970252 [Erythranthe guttata]XP_012850516.1 PREDICTED: uncharacterized protein LOC105970252 [Erythranthe guttata]|eukprot:XP_012850515.1 PREDICTED: uncharacterized protein LOC105970252 [Erythranthe guttata]
MDYCYYESNSIHNKWYQSIDAGKGRATMVDGNPSTNSGFPRFDGQYPRIWLWRCNRYFLVNPMNEQQKVFMASMHLDGKVNVWYTEYADVLEYFGWETFSNIVKDTFSEEEGVSSVAEFNRLKQVSSVEDLSSEIEGTNEEHKVFDEMTKTKSKLITNGKEEHLAAVNVGKTLFMEETSEILEHQVFDKMAESRCEAFVGENEDNLNVNDDDLNGDERQKKRESEKNFVLDGDDYKLFRESHISVHRPKLGNKKFKGPKTARGDTKEEPPGLPNHEKFDEGGTHGHTTEQDLKRNLRGDNDGQPLEELLMEAVLIEGRHMFKKMAKPKLERNMFDETKSKLESFAGEEIKACSGDKFQVICLDMGDLGGKIWNGSLTNIESDELICLKNLFPANRLKCAKPWRMPPEPPPLHYEEEFNYSTSTSIQFTKVMKEISQQAYWIRDFVKKKCCYKWFANDGDWFSSRSRFWDTPLSIGKEGCWPCNKYLFFVVENGVGNRESGTNMRIGAVVSEIWTGDVIYWEFGDNFVSAELEDIFFNLSPAELLPGIPLSKPAEKLLLAYARPASNVRIKHTSKGGDNFQAEIISFVELAATSSGISHKLHECGVLWSALERSVCTLKLTIVLAKGMFRIFWIVDEKTVASFKKLAAIPRMLKVQKSKRFCSPSALAESTSCEAAFHDVHEISLTLEMTWSGAKCMKKLMELFAKYFSLSDDAKFSILCTSMCITFMFDLFWEEGLRSVMLKYVLEFKKIVPLSEEDQKAKVFMCSKYLETFTQLDEQVNNFAELSIELLAENEEKLILNVIQMVTCLLLQNETSKVVFNVLEFSTSHGEKELVVCLSDDGCKFWGMLVSNLENDMGSLDSNSSFIPRRRPPPEPPPVTSWSYLTVIIVAHDPCH